MSNPSRIQVVAALAALPLFAAALHAQSAAPYSAAAAGYNFFDITSDSAAILKNADEDTVEGIGIGFTFHFFGQDYDKVCIAMNGTIAFGGCVGSRDNKDLTSGAPLQNYPVVAPLWGDLTTDMYGGDAVYYKTDNASTPPRFVVQWNNVYVVGSTQPVTFQAILYKDTNEILFQYRTIAGAGAKTTVGVRDASGQSSGCRMQWSYKADVLKDASAVLFKPVSLSKVDVVLAANRPGQLLVDSNLTDPGIVNWEPCSRHTIAVPDPATGAETRYVFSSWSDGGARSHLVYAPTESPVEAPVTYTAALNTQYLLTLAASPDASGTLSATPNAADFYYDDGASVQVAAAANAGYQFSTFTGAVTGATAPPLTMDGPKSVTGDFTALVKVTIGTVPAGLTFTVDGETYAADTTISRPAGSSISVSASGPQTLGGVRYGYSAWSDGGAATHPITVPADASAYSATFVQQYPLTVAKSPNSAGSVAFLPPSADGFYNVGAVVKLTASPTDPNAYAFGSWSGDASGTDNPLSVTVSAARAITANFVPFAAVTVATTPPGLTFLVDGKSYSETTRFGTWIPDSIHTVSVSDQDGATGTRYVFSGWSDAGGATHPYATPASGATLTASFETRYKLTVNAVSGGTLSVNPASPTGDGWYVAGTVVQVGATAGDTSVFGGFTGDVLTGKTPNPQSLTMWAPHTVGATFTGLPAVTIDSSPSGRVIKVDGNDTVTPKTFYWAADSVHQVVAASPQPVSSTSAWLFTSWTGGVTSGSITTPQAGGRYVANFQQAYLLTTAPKNAGSGTVNVTSGARQDNFYLQGDVVQITAAPASGMMFAGYSDGATGSTNPLSITMGAAPKNVIADFPVKTTNVTIATVPAGMDVLIDGMRFTGPYVAKLTDAPHSISVTPPAAASGSRYVFAGWSDGGAQTHSLNPPFAAAYTATLTAQYLLTATTNPAAGGTLAITLTSGTDGGGGWYGAGSVVQVRATANTWYKFSAYSGSLGGSTNPQSLAMNAPKTLVGNFAALAPSLYAAFGAKTDSGAFRDVLVTLTNGGLGPANGATITGIKVVAVVGGGSVIVPLDQFPLAVGSLDPGKSGSAHARITWPATATRVQFTVSFSATGPDGKPYSSTTTLAVYR